LKLLNLEGNPVSKENEYRMFVLAYLNDLTYLDYSMVTKGETAAAREQYQDELLDVEEKENLEAEKVNRELVAAKHTQKLKDANLTVVETIFDDMFAEDAEIIKLKHLPGVIDIINSFQSEVESASDLLLQTGLTRDEQKRHNESEFECALYRLREKFAKESVILVENFERLKKLTLKALLDSHRIESNDLEILQASLANLISSLVDLEMRQVEQCEDIIAEYEARFLEVKLACLEGQQSYFRLIEEHENNFTRDLMHLVNELLDKAVKEELPEDLSDEAHSLLVDRDACTNAITGSHDVHVGRLYRREDEAKHTEEILFKLAITRHRDDEHDRSRSRIIELKTYEDTCCNELKALVSQDIDEDDPE